MHVYTQLSSSDFTYTGQLTILILTFLAIASQLAITLLGLLDGFHSTSNSEFNGFSYYKSTVSGNFTGFGYVYLNMFMLSGPAFPQ